MPGKFRYQRRQRLSHQPLIGVNLTDPITDFIARELTRHGPEPNAPNQRGIFASVQQKVFFLPGGITEIVDGSLQGFLCIEQRPTGFGPEQKSRCSS